MKERLSINQWAEEDRPREKMLLHGVAALSNAELLAILIGSGNAEESAVELMRKILKDYHDNLSELGKCDVDELCRYKGIGQAKAISILAASELGKRRRDGDIRERDAITCSRDIYQYFYPLMCDLPVEECWLLLLNHSMKVLERVKISGGGLTETSVDIRCVLREALIKRATSIALCHNHPSGNATPSKEDLDLTHQLENAGILLGIKVLDHLIIGKDKYYSFLENGDMERS